MASEFDFEAKEKGASSPTVEAASDATESKEAFLTSFTPQESHAIIRKVDRRFLLVIGMMYLIKNVSFRSWRERSQN